MKNIDSIDSILNAINEINLIPKKKIKKIISNSSLVPKVNQNLKISPDIDKLILEAEDHKNKISPKVSQINLNHEKNSKINLKDVRDSTAEIISKLHLQIKGLENKLKVSSKKKIHSIDIDLLTDNNKPTINLDNQDILKDEVFTSLKIQDSSIALLNEKIKIFKKQEEKLLFQIKGLEQDKTILLKKNQKFNELKDYRNDITIKLKSIYKHVEKQKFLFVDLQNYSIKIKRNLGFFKENYENLIVENKEIKKRLTITKEKIVTHERNKANLLLSINQLNKILSKTNIAANISPVKTSSNENILEKENKSESIE